MREEVQELEDRRVGKVDGDGVGHIENSRRFTFEEDERVEGCHYAIKNLVKYEVSVGLFDGETAMVASVKRFAA